MRGAENEGVEKEVGSAGGLVKVHVAAAAVVGGKVEDDVHAFD